MSKTSTLILLSGLILASGCATTPGSDVSLPADHKSVAAQEATETKMAAASKQAPESAEFPPEILYQLLIAEVAGQRGELGVAVANYLAAARASRDSNVAKRATQLAVFAQALHEGLEAGQLWAELEPESTEPLQIVAPLLLTFGRTPEAITQFKRLIELSADKPDHNLMQIASQLAREGNQTAAMSVMEDLVAYRESDPYAWLALGQLAMRQKKLEPALEAVDQALTLRAHWAPGVVLRAQIIYAQGDKDAAIAFLAKERKGKLADDVGVGLTYARMLADSGKLAEALKVFERLARQQPGSGELHFAAGVLALQFKALDQAEGHFKQTLALGYRQQETIYHLGRVYEQKGEYEEAIEHYMSVEINDYYFESQMRVGNLLVKEGDLEAAIDHLRGIRVADKDEEVRLYLLEGEWLRDAGKLRESLDFYTEKLQQNPENTSLHYSRALVAESVDDLELAEQDLLFIIERDPTNAQALNALGYTLADRTSRFQEALEYIERALAVEPDDGVIIDSMGWVQYRLGNLPQAEEYLRRALELSGDPEVAAHLGEVLWMMGNKKDARRVWEDFLKKYPDHETLRGVMQRFGL